MHKTHARLESFASPPAGLMSSSRHANLSVPRRKFKKLSWHNSAVCWLCRWRLAYWTHQQSFQKMDRRSQETPKLLSFLLMLREMQYTVFPGKRLESIPNLLGYPFQSDHVPNLGRCPLSALWVWNSSSDTVPWSPNSDRDFLTLSSHQ